MRIFLDIFAIVVVLLGFAWYGFVYIKTKKEEKRFHEESSRINYFKQKYRYYNQFPILDTISRPKNLIMVPKLPNEDSLHILRLIDDGIYFVVESNLLSSIVNFKQDDFFVYSIDVYNFGLPSYDSIEPKWHCANWYIRESIYETLKSAPPIIEVWSVNYLEYMNLGCPTNLKSHIRMARVVNSKYCANRLSRESSIPITIAGSICHPIFYYMDHEEESFLKSFESSLGFEFISTSMESNNVVGKLPPTSEVTNNIKVVNNDKEIKKIVNNNLTEIEKPNHIKCHYEPFMGMDKVSILVSDEQ